MSERYRGLRFEKKKPKWLPAVIFVAVIVSLIGGILFINHTYDEYLKLEYADKLVIDEFNKLIINESNNKEIADLDLKNKTVVFISEDNFRVFVLNSKKMKNSLFNQKVKLADKYAFDCYKVSILNPSVIKLLMSSDTPKVGKTYTLNGEEVYYYRYNRDYNIDEKYSTNHLSVELIFNMYNYYKQSNWSPVLELNTTMITNETYAAYSDVFNHLSEMQFELGKENPDKQKLGEYAYQYVRAVDKMKEINPEYTEKALYRETYMGVPRYYSIKGAKETNYNFGVMYYNNEQNVSFRSVLVSINSGGVSKSFLYERGSYEVGALITNVLDYLGVDYRSKVEQNSKDKKVTLYDILVEYLDVPEDL